MGIRCTRGVQTVVRNRAVAERLRGCKVRVLGPNVGGESQRREARGRAAARLTKSCSAEHGQAAPTGPGTSRGSKRQRRETGRRIGSGPGATLNRGRQPNPGVMGRKPASGLARRPQRMAQRGKRNRPGCTEPVGPGEAPTPAGVGERKQAKRRSPGVACRERTAFGPGPGREEQPGGSGGAKTTRPWPSRGDQGRDRFWG